MIMYSLFMPVMVGISNRRTGTIITLLILVIIMESSASLIHSSFSHTLTLLPLLYYSGRYSMTTGHHPLPQAQQSPLLYATRIGDDGICGVMFDV